MVAEHNAKYQVGEVLSTLRLNQFSDLTAQEFRSTYLSDHVPTDDFTCKGPQYPKKTTFNDSFMTNQSIFSLILRHAYRRRITRPMRFRICIRYISRCWWIDVQDSKANCSNFNSATGWLLERDSWQYWMCRRKSSECFTLFDKQRCNEISWLCLHRKDRQLQIHCC